MVNLPKDMPLGWFVIPFLHGGQDLPHVWEHAVSTEFYGGVGDGTSGGSRSEVLTFCKSVYT